MRLNIKYTFGAALLVLGISACTDTIKFGDAFLEKAPGGTVTADTVFSNPEYTRQYLSGIYAMQFYNLPTNSTNNPPQCQNYWKGMVDALDDTYQLFFNNTTIFKEYYNGTLSDNGGGVYPYDREYVWENVRHCWTLIDKVDGVPGMEQAEKDRIKDEARCLLASTYFTIFRYYGGLPIIRGTFSGTESSYHVPRGSVEQTVNFMVDLLDEVIKGNHLPWGYTGAEAVSETGRWTKAGAMALKCKVLQFAASPLFNADKPYYDGKYTVENDSVAWYGSYKPELWKAFKQACDEFFQQLNANGIYHLVVPAGNTQEDYRYAYRSSYLLQGSPEIIQSIRRAATTHGNDNQWFNLRNNDRYSYTPTQEFVEMFPWADGTPFDWDKAQKDGMLDYMFVKGDTVKGTQMLQNRKYTRDPRLYETVAVNGALQTINWGDGRTSGANYEAWVGGTTVGTHPSTNTGLWANGYRNLKYIAGDAYDRKFPQWNLLLLSDMYLTYAEALIQADNNLTEAIKYIDAVRARVGLKGLVECNPDKNLTTDKKNLMEELMRERACELALQASRYFDMIRYKRADLFERTLHGLRIYRLSKDAGGKWVRDNSQWYNKSYNKNLKETDPNFYEPSHFDYERFEITTGVRIWWTDGFDPKWYLQPFPQTEVNKGYGCIQNPGW
jgi:hypothetical protein